MTSCDPIYLYMHPNANNSENKAIFNQLKPLCVPLLASSQLSPATSKHVHKLLTDLERALSGIHSSGRILSNSLTSYVSFPVKTMLKRNSPSEIPDQVLEKLLSVLAYLSESWWWHCDTQTWQEILMLCGAVVGGLERRENTRDRDDETKAAALRCLNALLYERTSSQRQEVASIDQSNRFQYFQTHAQTPQFIPILGQTLNSILATAEAQNHELQRVSLSVLDLLVRCYAPDYFVPSILPGTTSTTVKVAMGRRDRKGWANGDIVVASLQVLQSAIVRSLGDDICVAEGAVDRVQDLEDLSGNIQVAQDPTREPRPFETLRTTSWLRATSSQVHIAINSLAPLVQHPTPSALHGLSTFSATLLKATSLTLPQTRPLLLSFLLSLSQSQFPRVSSAARAALLSLLTTPSPFQFDLVQTLAQMTKDSLSSIPRLIPAQADAKVRHAAELVEAVCNLSDSNTTSHPIGLHAISTEVGRLLGPTGGIEKWGWSLLSVMEIAEAVSVETGTFAQFLLEGDASTIENVSFPTTVFRNIDSRDTAQALERMFNALGRAAGDACIFAIEWFSDVGRSGAGASSIAALWCACRLLEGAAGISLATGSLGESLGTSQSKPISKLSRTLTRSISELWDKVDLVEQEPHLSKPQSEDTSLIVHGTGLNALSDTLKILKAPPEKNTQPRVQPLLHKAFALQIFAISGGVLGARYASSFIYVLYPILHSLVSASSHLSSTAFAALSFVTNATSYASPANLLLSNFDYALDAVSRRLTHRWLDVDATKVFVVLVRLVGSDIVDRAGDVVEECFDRLDDFHGYEAIVEGLVEVLSEVLRVIETHTPPITRSNEEEEQYERLREVGNITQLLNWLAERHNATQPFEVDNTDYGPAPRQAWGKDDESGENAVGEEGPVTQPEDATTDSPPTPIQALTKQIITRSVYFMTHSSPTIRARILSLIGSSIPVLPESALLPAIHSAWPFILNRLADPQPFVVSSAADLVETLTTHVGSFMFRRIWDDVWPRFRTLLVALDAGDKSSALARRGPGAIGTESSYTHSHRLYRSLIRTMNATVAGVHPHESSLWQVTLAFRRFLNKQAHEELQRCARDLYIAIGQRNADLVWLALVSTIPETCDSTMRFLPVRGWDIQANVKIIMDKID